MSYRNNDPLGGDLSGNEFNAAVVSKINGATVPVSGSLTTGNVLQVNGSSSLTYAAVNLAGGSNYVTGVLPTGNQAAQNLTLTGDATSSGGTTSTASTTVVALRGKTLASALSTIGSTQDGYVLTWDNADGYWAARAATGGGGTVTWASDLSGNGTSTSTNQYVSSLSYSSSSAGGVIAINGTGTSLQWANGNTAPAINQAAPAATNTPAAGSNTTLTAQAGTAAVSGNTNGGAGGNFIVNSGTGGVKQGSGTNGASGKILLQIAGTTELQIDNGVTTSSTTTFAFANTAPAITLRQTGLGSISGSGASGQTLTIAAQAGQATTGNTTSGNGGALILNSGVGGSIGNLGPAQTGGAITIAAGNGGASNSGAGALTSGIGGAITINGGAGGLASAAANSATGNTGGALTIAGGTGGAATSASSGLASAGNGATLTATGGAGGLATGSTNQNATGGTGANVVITGGTGGNATQAGSGGTMTGGNGGNVVIGTGSGGTATGGSTNTAGTTGKIQLQIAGNNFMQITNHGLNLQTVTETSNYTIDSGSTPDYFVLCNPSSGFTVTLPAPTAGRVLVIKDISGTAETNNITIARNASESIEGIAASYILQTNWGVVRLTSDSTNWFIT